MFQPIHLRHKYTILYGLAMAGLLVVLKWLELRFVVMDHAFEVYAGSIALLFTGLGIWVAVKIAKPKIETRVETRIETRIIEKEVYLKDPSEFIPNETAITELGLSKRELEVLQLMAEGLSNQEIAERLIVSLNTIKSHTSKVFEKLNVKRRTQAVDKARSLRIIR